MITFQDDRHVFVLAPSVHIYRTLSDQIRSTRANGTVFARRGGWVSAPHHACMAKGLPKFHVIQPVSPRPMPHELGTGWVSQEMYETAVQELAEQFQIMAGRRPESFGNMWIRVVLP
jgi:hypothetical protein